MPFFTISWAPPDAEPEMTLISFPPEVCQALIAGFGPTYAASSWPASSAVASSVPVLKGVSFSVTPLPRFLVKNPCLTAIRALACVMFSRNPRRSTTLLAEVPDAEVPDALDPDEADEPQPAARATTAAAAAVVSARRMVHLFRLG